MFSHKQLSKREREILECAAGGMTAVDTAKHLGISHGSVKQFRRHLFNKMGVDTIAQAVYHAMKAGILALILLCVTVAHAQFTCSAQPTARTTTSAASVATTVSVNAGDLILVHYAWSGSGLTPSISDSNTNSYTAGLVSVLSNGSTVNMQEYYAVAKSTNASLTITASTSANSAHSNIYVTSCSGATNWAAETPATLTATSANPGAPISVAHNAVVLWAGNMSTSSGSSTVGTGYSKAMSNFSGCLAYVCAEYQVVNASAIAGNPWSGSFTLASSTWAAYQAAFYDAGSTPSAKPSTLPLLGVGQ